MTQDTNRGPDERKRAVAEFVYEQQWDHAENVDEWTGEDLEDLRAFMTDEEFQSVIDHLGEAEPDQP